MLPEFVPCVEVNRHCDCRSLRSVKTPNFSTLLTVYLLKRAECSDGLVSPRLFCNSIRFFYTLVQLLEQWARSSLLSTWDFLYFARRCELKKFAKFHLCVPEAIGLCCVNKKKLGILLPVKIWILAHSEDWLWGKTVSCVFFNGLRIKKGNDDAPASSYCLV